MTARWQVGSPYQICQTNWQNTDTTTGKNGYAHLHALTLYPFPD